MKKKLSYLYVNNRIEGCAPVTLAGMVAEGGILDSDGLPGGPSNPATGVAPISLVMQSVQAVKKTG